MKSVAAVPRSIHFGGAKIKFHVLELINLTSTNNAHPETGLLTDKILTNVPFLAKTISVQVVDVLISQRDLLVLAIERVTIGPMENVPISMNVHFQQFIATVANVKILKAVIFVLVLR